MSVSETKPSRTKPGPDRLEWLVLIHVGAFVLFAAWAFGGQAPFARTVIRWWGTAGIVLFCWACKASHRPASGRWHPGLRLLWPLWLYDALVIASLFNPGFVEIMVADEPSLMMVSPHPWMPSAALPQLAAHELWQFNGLVLSSFNLYLVLRRRGQIRRMLFLIAGSAVALAIFGSFQKLVGAKGLWFGLVASPNPRFFSTFIYHNHWGAFTLLNISACLGLLFHYHRQGGHRDFWHSPVLLGAVLTLLLALSLPLSASRSCSVLGVLLLSGALVQFLRRLTRQRRKTNQSATVPVAGVILAVLFATGAIGFLSRKMIAERYYQTSHQVAAYSGGDSMNERLILYRDTWRMASERPWSGWGLESYAHVFQVFNTQRPAEIQWWRVFYAEAHNDWLQSLAEVGFVGTGLLVLLILLPLGLVLRRGQISSIPRHLLTSCAVLALYAWVEFPFANPAVVLTWLVLYYSAVRYIEIENATRHE